MLALVLKSAIPKIENPSCLYFVFLLRNLYTYFMRFDQIYLPFSPFQFLPYSLPQLSPLNFRCLFLFCKDSLSLINAVCLCTGVGPSTCAWASPSGPASLKKTYSPFTGSHLLPTASQIWLAIPRALHLHWASDWFDLLQVLCTLS